MIPTPQAFCTRVEKKTSCILVCATHLEIVLMTGINYFCSSEDRGDFLFQNLYKRYCNHCVKYYLRKIYDIYPFNVFNE